jgi:hypothetical protein
MDLFLIVQHHAHSRHNEDDVGAVRCLRECSRRHEHDNEICQPVGLNT